MVITCAHFLLTPVLLVGVWAILYVVGKAVKLKSLVRIQEVCAKMLRKTGLKLNKT